MHGHLNVRLYHCCVYNKKTPDDGQRNCPKHVEFYSKSEFEKLVHLVGFIIRIRVNVAVAVYFGVTGFDF